MRVLLVGLSLIGTRRVIPALAAIDDDIVAIDIASASKASPGAWPKQGDWFDDDGRALSASQADLVYISLPNAVHERWGLEALGSGRNLIIDKLAVMSLDGARRYVELASSGSLLLAEATVFAAHPQIQALKTLLLQIGPLTHMEALFIIAPLPRENFRNDASIGGGRLLDIGPYAAAVARPLGDELETLCALTARLRPGQVDVDFSLAVWFHSGLRYTGHFSFESEYQNRLTVIGRHGSVVVDRVISPPAESPLQWQVRRQNEASEIVQTADEMFRVFLETALQAIRDRNLDEFASTLLKDVVFRAQSSTSFNMDTPND